MIDAESPAMSISPAIPQRRPLLRTLLLAPPALLGVAAMILLVTSPLAWDAGRNADLPAWTPPALGAFVALLGLLVAIFSLRRTLRETDGDFEVFGLHLVGGLLTFIFGAVMMVSLAIEIPDSANYTESSDRIGPSGRGFFVMSLVLGAFNVGCIWVCAYLYSHAISNLQPNRISARLPGEVDGVGELLKESR
jgi:hypothetical protein